MCLCFRFLFFLISSVAPAPVHIATSKNVKISLRTINNKIFCLSGKFNLETTGITVIKKFSFLSWKKFYKLGEKNE